MLNYMLDHAHQSDVRKLMHEEWWRFCLEEMVASACARRPNPPAWVPLQIRHVVCLLLLFSLDNAHGILVAVVRVPAELTRFMNVGDC